MYTMSPARFIESHLSGLMDMYELTQTHREYLWVGPSYIVHMDVYPGGDFMLEVKSPSAILNDFRFYNVIMSYDLMYHASNGDNFMMHDGIRRAVEALRSASQGAMPDVINAHPLTSLIERLGGLSFMTFELEDVDNEGLRSFVALGKEQAVCIDLCNSGKYVAAQGTTISADKSMNNSHTWQALIDRYDLVRAATILPESQLSRLLAELDRRHPLGGPNAVRRNLLLDRAVSNYPKEISYDQEVPNSETS